MDREEWNVIRDVLVVAHVKADMKMKDSNEVLKGNNIN
jgi:hypothetical protein